MLPADFANWRVGLATSISGNGRRPGPVLSWIPFWLASPKKNRLARPVQSNGRKEQTSFCIVDSQSVKNTDTAGHRAMTQARRCRESSVIPRWTRLGLTPHAIHVTTADVTTARPGLWRCLTGAETGWASVKCRTCWWTGVTPESPLRVHCGARPVGSPGGSGETQRTAHLRGASKAMGGGAVFRLAGKVPPTLEELRKA